MSIHILMAVGMIIYFAFGMGGKHMMMMRHDNMNHEMNHTTTDSTNAKKEPMKNHDHEMKKEDENHDKHSEAKKDTLENKAWNTVCPVLGNEVDSETELVEYNGKYYGFCCPGCDTRFKKNPEKYSKNLNEDGTKFIKK